MSLYAPNKYQKIRSHLNIHKARQKAFDFLARIGGRDVQKDVIISSEFFVSMEVVELKAMIDAFQDVLGSHKAEIVIYCRRPESLYLSLSQQRLKADCRITPFYQFAVKYSRLSRFKNVGCAKLSVREFSRNALIEQCVVADFLYHFLDLCLGDYEVPSGPMVQSNLGLSAESLWALQVFNLHQQSAGIAVKMGKHSRSVVEALRSFDADHLSVVTTPRLIKFVSNYITLSHAQEMSALNSEYDVFADSVFGQEGARSRSPESLTPQYTFAGRGSDFSDIRSILEWWDPNIAEKAFAFLVNE